jgi:hypothetical protein
MRSFRIALSSLMAVGSVAGCSANDAPSTTASSSQALANVSVYHSQQSGGGAQGSVYQQDANTYFSASFDAWENKTGKTRTAALSFWGYGATTQQVCFDEQICVWDPNTWTCNYETYQYCYQSWVSSRYVYGYGDIPTGDFRVGSHTARLTTDLSQDSSFYAIQCSYDQWTYSCTPVTGTIDLTWRDNGNFTTEQNGVSSTQSTSTYSQYSTHTTGHQSNASADVTGTFLGNAVTSQGSISLSKDSNVTKEVFKAPPPPPPGGDAGGPPPPPPPDGG